ncbi:HAMP domain-containing sensor histidine kinase [Chryseobacterium sp. 2987]|uniref:sensor histidine kinase n=1 Tax=Chryseobacterium sp. 2987 TaxID=2817767 RepID=UPI00285D34F1|nr:HAMP domain-containing sensor histidine kinase [Chryseobacterium sp. 2987]MDR6923227.1 two-component system phosphate regulon sensor histidine kinase PhoR [Chryseobacterium sp. 2987]
MISKSKYLIALFATLFLLLLGIQVYFIYKTYQVKEREVYRTIQDGLSGYTDKLEDISSIKEMKDDSLQKTFIRYYDKEISKQEFLDFFVENRRAIKERLLRYLDYRMKTNGYDIAAKIEYTSIIHIPDSTRLIDKPILLFETKNKVTNPKITNEGSWETSSKNESGKGKLKNNSFLIKSNTEFEISNIKSIVFKELILLILCCIALLTGVMMLFIFTVRNLVRQQKQVEVLHTIVDNISHEFKTPIATLKIASKALKKDWNTETLPLIERQISRLESLMFQLHKDETEGNLSQTQPEDWNFFIQDLAFTYPQINFELKNHISGVLPFDKNLMETVIKNLCENSVKYGSSVVKININRLTEHVEIEVTDNGQGIEKKELKNIFEKFYRVQSNNIHNSKGLGLGLYFVKNIVNKYHGKIDVSSRPEMGTIFKIILPYEN